MKITVFTSNHPRHVHFIHRLAGIADSVYAVQECRTLSPGVEKDSIYAQSPLMQRYFEHVTAAEKKTFGDTGKLPANVKTLPLTMGELSQMDPSQLAEAMRADVFTVFGASYIKPPLIDALIERRAVNIHMGVSPYYRGSSCNFWAVYDNHPELVGATIHLLSRGLDSGNMLFHALPQPQDVDPFLLGMKAVEAAQAALAAHIKNNTLHTLDAVPQDKAKELRYSRHSDFNDAIVDEYLKRVPSAAQVGEQLRKNQHKHALKAPVWA